MTTTVNLKRILDRKQWEMVTFAPVANTTGSFIVSSSLFDQYQYFITSNTAAYLYSPQEDSWITLPSPGLAGTFGAGTCGARHTHGPRAFPTAGTTTTITTNLNLQRVLKDYKIRILAGPNAGNEYTIKSNTLGANAVITITTTAGSAFTTASEFILLTGRVWVVNGGTVAAGSFKYYDVATNTWNNATQTGLPATIGTDGKLVATSGVASGTFDSGTATSGSATTLVRSSATWFTNTWTNYQVRITAGTGAGQIRTISSNTATTLTVPTWTTNPDATSQFSIEGNDDFLYFLGNNAVTMYRYSISGNSWTTLSPVAARAGAPAAGMSASWIAGVTDSSWNNLTTATDFLNGQYIYSFRGGAGSVLDRYNISANTWESAVVYAPATETFTTGTSYSYTDDYILISIGNTGRILKFDPVRSCMEPFSTLFYAQSTALLGDRFFDVVYDDGGTRLRFIYFMTHSQTTMFRTLVF